MSDSNNVSALKALFRVAIPAADQLPPAQRADVYEGMAVASALIDADLSETAASVARDLRAAQSAQLLFKEIVS